MTTEVKEKASWDWNWISRCTIDSEDVTAFDKANEVVEELFTYSNWDESQKHDGAAVKDSLVNAFVTILVHVPAGPARTSALRKIYEARMDANSAITHKGRV